MSELRKKVWIGRFQTLLALRIAFYFLFYQVAVWLVISIERSIFVALDEMLGHDMAVTIYLFLVAAVVAVGIVFIYEAVKFAHRLVGPLVRFRHVIKAITAGEKVDLVNLRKDDFLYELRDEFNEMLLALEQRGAVTLRNKTVEQPAQLPATPQTSLSPG